MKRLLIACGALLVLALPPIVFAAYGRPSDLLLLENPEGKPSEFKMAIYSEVKDGAETFQLFGNIRGYSEGKSQKEVKADIWTDLTLVMGDESLSGSAEIMVYEGKVYVNISQVDVKGDIDEREQKELENFNKNIKGKWFVIDASPQTEFSGNSLQDFVDEYGLSFDKGQLKEGLAQILDAAFAMETTKFKEGTSYLLTLKPNFIKEALAAWDNWMRKNDPSLASSSLLGDDPEIAAFDELLNKAMKLRVKIDTNIEDAFRFGKYYFSLSIPDSGVSVSLEGTSSHRTAPVYLIIPKDAQKIDVLLETLGVGSMISPPAYPPLPTVPTPEMTPPPFVPPTFPQNTEERIACLRNGTCPQPRVTRRTLLELKEQNSRVR